MKNLKRIITCFVWLALCASCGNDSGLEKEIAKIPVDVEIIRFDRIFDNATPSDLPQLKTEFSLFFPERFHDSIWTQQFTDTLQKQLRNEVFKAYPAEEELASDLANLFQHIKYYYGNFTVPKIYTATSDVDYRTKVVSREGLLVLELDNYLGSDHFFYAGISKFISKNMKPEMLVSDVATSYTRNYVDVPKQRSLLAQMIYFGKELYLKDLWLPNTEDYLKIGYTDAELNWAQENEAQIWRYFVEEELLYSTDAGLAGRFITPAPFSKFNLELDNESPGMIGRYMGWQILRSYVKNNEVPLEELMNMNPEELFKNSKYKPNK